MSNDQHAGPKLVMSAIVAGVVLHQDSRYLLVQENDPQRASHEKWNLPAGRVEEGRTIEEVAVQEAKEETGYDVELLRKLDIFQEHAQTPPKHAFEAKIIGGELRWPAEEILEARWFSYPEIVAMEDQLRSAWVLGAIRLVEQESVR